MVRCGSGNEYLSGCQLNAVPCFQGIADQIIKSSNCEGTDEYLNNITVGGANQQEHDVNLAKFLAVAKNHNLTFKESKCVYNTNAVDFLGYRITTGSIQPDLKRVKTLHELPSPEKLQRTAKIGCFIAYYTLNGLHYYSDEIKPLIINTNFPLKDKVLALFTSLKSELISDSLGVINESVPFVVRADASSVAVSATLT